MRHALILAGGGGTRLWPLSTKACPKQLAPLVGDRSLLALAFERAAACVPTVHIWVVASETFRAAAIAALPGLAPDRFLAEPCGRDTLPATGLGLAAIATVDPDASVLVLTSDHLIEPLDVFAAAANDAFALAESDSPTLVTFGIAPTFAATGYGWLTLGPVVAHGARHVRCFTEKPSAAVAETLLAAGPTCHLWNSGMFCWRASVFLDAMDRHAPAHAPVLRALGSRLAHGPLPATDVEAFAALPRRSVDHGVMEPAAADPRLKVVAIPLSLRWLDIGAWPAFAAAQPPESDEQTRVGSDILLHASHGCLVANTQPGHLVAVLGGESLIVVHTPEATLICPAKDAQKVKELQALVAARWPGKA